jgi:hypothetical protein
MRQRVSDMNRDIIIIIVFCDFRWSDFFGDGEVETVDVTQQLRKFLLQVVGNQNALINVLKSVNQSVYVFSNTHTITQMHTLYSF